MLISEEDYLAHYGTPRHSGRYPWGSGGEEDSGEQRNMTLLDHIDHLKKQGLSEIEIAKGLDLTTTQLRAQKSIEKNRIKQDQIGQAQRLKDKGYSNIAIGQRMNLNESSVRALLAPGEKDKLDVLHATAKQLRDQVEQKGLIDIGTGTEQYLNVSRDKMNTAIALLQSEGYKVHYVKIRQVGTNKDTSAKILSAPGVTYSEVFKNKDNIKQISGNSEDGGHTYDPIHPPLQLSSKRVGIRYAEQGGADADGVMYVRPGVKDVSLGGARYAQVRVAVDGTHYIKGMAMYKDDLPAGVDVLFNTNKSNTGNKLDALKKVGEDEVNPFGTITRQIKGEDKKPSSVMNLVNEEGDWEKWSQTLSSQFLSKQSPSLAKAQLDLAYKTKKDGLDEILALSNPTVKKKLLESFASSADSSAVHLKAAAINGTRNHVILPINSLSEKEVYAPNYNNGTKVVLIRHPHGGVFEIPELTVNNNHPESKKLLGRIPDAIGINAKVAEKLSGADFDGDTVLVIPNDSRRIKTAPSLEGLKKFDPKVQYKAYDGMPEMTDQQKGFQMGDVSNLITDMTIKGANQAELARAVRHSMVVIDAQKHKLNYKQSAKDNGIRQLKQKYQQKPNGRAGGASTLVSRASADLRVNERVARKATEGGPFDKATGKKVFTETGASYTDKNGHLVIRKTKTTQLAEAANAHDLSSGTTIEKVYADYSNSMKDLGDQARKALGETPNLKYNDSARKTYSAEVKSLNAKLKIAVSNRPRERQAQILANATIAQKRRANPDMDAATLKKVKSQALIDARLRTGALKERITFTDAEWKAVQAGAISNHKLEQMLANADLDQVKKLATPKTTVKMTTVKKQRAQLMINAGYTQAEIANALGVSLSTLKASLGGEE